MGRKFKMFAMVIFVVCMLFACESPNVQTNSANADADLNGINVSVSKAVSSIAVPTYSLSGASQGVYVRKSSGSTTITAPSGSVLYYTTDGSDPRSSSTRKTPNSNTVTISLTATDTTNGNGKGGYKFKATAYSGGSYSDVSEERYIINTSSYSIPAINGSDVMLQAFNWLTATPATAWYTTLQNNATEIKNFNWVWMPPPSDSMAIQGYMPRELYNFTNGYGTAAQQQNAINAIKGGTNNTKLIADIVINHRVGTSAAFDSFTNPVWDKYQIVYENYKGTDDNGDGVPDNNGYGGAGFGWGDTGGQFGAARDIDHTDPVVQKDVLDFLSRLKTMGYAGFRYDYVKGYSAQYNGFYNALSQAEFSVGELWDDGVPQNGLNNWVTTSAAGGAQSMIFDFSLKGDLNAVFGWYKKNANGTYTNTAGSNNMAALKRSDATKQTGYVGWQPANAVTFVDNHDTGSNQMHWALEGSKVYLAYVYTLTQSGIPCVFWDHYFNWNDSTNTALIGNNKTMQQHIKELINIRRAAGVTNTSLVTTQTVSSTVYSAKVGDNLYVKIGSGSYTPPGSGWTLYSGNNFAVWYKTSTTTTTTGGTSVTLSITKDVGSGNAVFFAGNFVESNSWAKAIRGTWNTGNVWTCNATLSSSSLEWKPLILTYATGDSVTPIPSNATWRSGNNITTPNGGNW